MPGESIDNLLARWEELCEQGSSPTPEELCRDRPELLDELRRQIQALEGIGVSLPPLVDDVAPLRPGRAPGAFDPFSSTVHSNHAPRSGTEVQGPAAVPPGCPAIAGYEILGELGRGGMGVVYKARQLGLNRLVALKMILGGSYAGPGELLRFRTEAMAVARLQHPNVVQIHEVGEQDGLPFFSLEFVAGGSLGQKLAGTPLPARAAAQLAEVLARAVHAAHQAGIVHRDLKPANVLLAPSDGPQAVPLGGTAAEPGRYEPKIADFGLAKHLAGDPGHSRTGDVLGTPSYMAPEQAAGKVREIGPLVDVYALGAILYELFTGRPPFKGATSWETMDQVLSQEPVPPSRLQPSLPRDLDKVCLKCLQKEPNKRYASALALAEDLGRFLGGRAVLARPTPWWERGVKWARRRPATAGLVAASFLALLSLAGLGWFAAHNRWERERAVDGARGNALQLLAAAEKARGQKEWPAARAALSEARGAVEGYPELAALKGQIEGLVTDTDRHVDDIRQAAGVQETYHQFLRLRGDALFHASLAVGENRASNQEKTRAAARAGLECFGVTPDDGQAPIFHEALGTNQRREIIGGLYELLLVWADAEAQPMPGEETEAVRARAGQALRILDRAAGFPPSVHPSHAYHARRARFLRQASGRDAEAARELDLAKERLPVTALDCYLSGDEKYKNGPNWQDAVPDFERAVNLEPKQFWPRYFLALCRLRSNDYPAAKNELDLCLEQQPDFAWPYLMRGFALEQMPEPDYAAAERDFAVAEGLEKKVPDPDARYALFVNRGVLYLRQGRLAMAGGELERAVALQPDRYEAYISLSQAFRHQQRPDRAIQKLTEGIRRGPARAGLALLYRNRAWCHLDRQERQEALADFDAASKAEPRENTDEAARDQGQRGWIFFQDGHYTEARAAYDRALELWPGYLKGYLGRGRTLLKLGQDQEAVRALDQYLDRRGKPLVELYEARGLGRTRLGKHQQAADDYTKALELRAGAHRLAGAGAWGLAFPALHAGSLQALGMLLADCNDAALHAACAWAWLRADLPRNALPEFDQAFRLDPGRAEAYLGRAFARLAILRPPERNDPDLEAERQFTRDLDQVTHDIEKAVTSVAPSEHSTLDGARALALTVARLDACRTRYKPEMVTRRRECQDRALQLLARAIALAGTGRAEFWRTYVEDQPAFVPLRQHPEYVRLALLCRG